MTSDVPDAERVLIVTCRTLRCENAEQRADSLSEVFNGLCAFVQATELWRWMHADMRHGAAAIQEPDRWLSSAHGLGVLVCSCSLPSRRLARFGSFVTAWYGGRQVGAAKITIQSVGAIEGNDGLIAVGKNGMAALAINDFGMNRGENAAGSPARAPVCRGEEILP